MIVVTGTDTGVGKTIVSAAIAAITGWPYVKAVQTGDDDDAAEVARLASVPVTTLARFPDPLAPASAGQGITAAEVVAGVTEGAIVEGAGGLLVRLGADDSTLADVAGMLGAAVVVVARAGLGTLNHTALTLEALRARGIECPGVVIGSWPVSRPPTLAERRNVDDLPRYAGVPLLGRVPEGAGRMDPAEFRAHAPTWIKGLL
jgi:dethiobiotin synthetase